MQLGIRGLIALVAVVAAAGIALVKTTGLSFLPGANAAGDAGQTPPVTVLSQAGTTFTAIDQQPSAAGDSIVSPAVAVEPATAPSPLAPNVPLGRTDLSDSVYAVRDSQDVEVIFDTPMGRTRRRDKFELMVRATLPMIYGSAADSALASVPLGELARESNLITELPIRGLTLSAPGGVTLELWPITRDGRDGPLVVSYRVIARR